MAPAWSKGHPKHQAGNIGQNGDWLDQKRRLAAYETVIFWIAGNNEHAAWMGNFGRGGLAESPHESVDVENSLDMRVHHRSELGVLQDGCDEDPNSMQNVP